MSKRNFTWSIAFMLVALGACTKTKAPETEAYKVGVEPALEVLPAASPEDEHQVDLPWTEEDERAIDELEAALKHAVESGDFNPESHVVATAVLETLPDHLLEIYVFSIGQADSMLVVGPAGKTLLIDLGERRQGVKPANFDSGREHVYKRIRDITKDTHIDYFVVTHYHEDHVGRSGGPSKKWGNGIIGLLSDFSVPFSVGVFIHIGDDGAEYMKSEDGRGSYMAIKKLVPRWIQYNRIERAEPPRFGTAQIDLGSGVTVEILAFAGKVPDGSSAFERAEAAGVDYSQTPGNENDLSIAMEISAGEFELFTAGDLNGTDDPVKHPLYVPRVFGPKKEIYTNIEHHMVGFWESSGRETDVEIYCANHHGSPYSNTAKLLDALDPEFILYSTGAGHGHPANSVVQNGATTARQFATTAVKHLNTFVASKGEQIGEIEILVALDGRSYTIDQKKHKAFSSSAEANGDDVGEEDRTH